jgi:hypothetical protein
MQGTRWWSVVYFWIGIAGLFVLGSSLDRYGLSNDAAAETSRAQEHGAELPALRPQFTEATEQATDAARKASTVEAKQASKHLTAAQKRVLTTALKPFAHQAIDVVVPMGDEEAQTFAADFVAVLRTAGWNTGSNDGIRQAVYTGPPPRGIEVTLNEQDVKGNTLPQGAAELIEALMQLGLAEMAFINPQILPGKIQLRVGSKQP